MAQRLDSLSTTSTLQNDYLIPVSDYDVTAYNISFEDFKSNLNKIRSTGVDLTIGANSDYPALTVKDTTRRVGIGSFYGASDTHAALQPLYDLEVAGTSGYNTAIGLRGSGVNQSLVFYDNNAAYEYKKTPFGDFSVKSSAADHPYIYFHSGSGTFISDGFGYQATGCDSDVNMQLYATDTIRFTVDDGTNALDADFTTSGIQSNGDFYFDYYSGANTSSGSFFGLSGAVFVSSHNQNVRVGNEEVFPDARLHVTNNLTDGVTYKTCLIEDENYPNLFFKQIDGSNTVSLTHNGASALYFGYNKSPSSISNQYDGVIFDLGNRRVGVGGINPSYTLDITGANQPMIRMQTDDPIMYNKMQLNYPQSVGDVETIFTTYTSGTKNTFLVGYDFENSYYYYQTGDTSDTYYPVRNTHKFYSNGDLDIKGSYTTTGKYCEGKFAQNYHTRCISSDIYVNPLHENSATNANISDGTDSPFFIAPFDGEIKKIKIMTADTSLSHFNGGRFEISVVDPSSGGTDEQLDCFSSVSATAPTSLPTNGVVAQFALTNMTAAGTVYTFDTWSGSASFTEGQLVQYRMCQSNGSAMDINSTIISTLSFTTT